MIKTEEELANMPEESAGKYYKLHKTTRVYNDEGQQYNDYNVPLTPGYRCARAGYPGCPVTRLGKCIKCEDCAHKYDMWEGPAPTKILHEHSEAGEFYYEEVEGTKKVLYY